MGSLATHVHVVGQDGRPLVLAPGDQVPDWAAEQITNPKAWAEPPGEASGERPGESSARGGIPPVPPRSGPGSGVRAWAAYADAYDVRVADGASREDIIAALEREGVPTEQSQE